MDLEAISGSATVAIACTIVFFIAAKSWHLVARTLGSQPSFPDAIMREAAQRFRDELERLRAGTFLGDGEEVAERSAGAVSEAAAPPGGRRSTATSSATGTSAKKRTAKKGGRRRPVAP